MTNTNNASGYLSQGLWSRNEAEIAEAVAMAHHLEKSLLQARIHRLTALLLEHGIPTPQDDPLLGASDGEHLEDCRQVVIAAYALLQDIDKFETALQNLCKTVGSGMEFIKGESWRT